MSGGKVHKNYFQIVGQAFPKKRGIFFGCPWVLAVKEFCLLIGIFFDTGCQGIKVLSPELFARDEFGRKKLRLVFSQ